MSQPLQTRLKLLFTQAGEDVSESILPDLLSFSFSDKETLEADTISITLKDERGKWAGTWQPNGGEVIKAYIQSGTTTNKGRSLYCGKFYVDRQSVSGSPRTYSLDGVSVPLDKPIRKKKKTTAWSGLTLFGICDEIAAANGLQLVYDAEDTVTYNERIEQQRESDLTFLMRLCEEAGLSLKVTDEKLVVFDQASYEKKSPVKTIILGKSDILSWSFESNQSEKYNSAKISYRDPKQKVKGSAGSQQLDRNTESTKRNQAVMEYTYYDPEGDANGQEYVFKARAKSLDEARSKAKAKLRELNKRAVTGSISMIGDVSLVAGVVIACKGFGSFDGNFIIEEATHTVDGGGYTTEITLRRVNKNY